MSLFLDSELRLVRLLSGWLFEHFPQSLPDIVVQAFSSHLKLLLLFVQVRKTISHNQIAMVIDWWIKVAVLLGPVASSAQCVRVKLLGSLHCHFRRTGFNTSDGVEPFRKSLFNWSLQDNNRFILGLELLDLLYLS